jgi:hypothetical protein
VADQGQLPRHQARDEDEGKSGDQFHGRLAALGEKGLDRLPRHVSTVAAGA